ncbi:MAG: replication protein RepA [Bacteroidota bacterium]
MNHAIPLDERALAALSHTAMELDIYVWLVQRLRNGQKSLLLFPKVKQDYGVQNFHQLPPSG